MTTAAKNQGAGKKLITSSISSVTPMRMHKSPDFVKAKKNESRRTAQLFGGWVVVGDC